MATPYTPTVLTTPAVNPATGSSGAPPIPYISLSEYQYAPTAMSTRGLKPGGTSQDQNQVLADTIRRATQWADAMCFGADPAAAGVSLAASLAVQSTFTTVKQGDLRLICDYKPILELIGCDVGGDPSTVTSIGTIAASARFGRRTIYIPFYGVPFRNGTTSPTLVPGTPAYGKLYAVWSYVNGYPHTQLVANVTEGATSCVVDATDGNGGMWGVYPASGAFPGTLLTVTDGVNTESVFVQAVAVNTPSSGKATLTTTAFANAHTLPTAPDFIPVSALPPDVHQAVISLTTMLIKTRGARAMEMPRIPGQMPREKWQNDQVIAQAGAMEDFQIARQLLTPYMVRLKSGS